jgi:1-acyl-sn-glycerol-3-phosphate acyltransferase
MMERLLLILRIVLTLVLMTVGAFTMLICAILTLFRKPRFYREFIGVALGKTVLRIWRIAFVCHGSPPATADQYVYISNHTSTIDMFALISLGLPNARFFLSGYLRKLLPMGLIGYLIGIFWTVPQDRPQQRIAIFKNAERVLRRTGESVYLSPEGERVTSGGVGHFNKGAFHLATVLKAPIVPLFIRIPPVINPGKGCNARPGTVDVFFAPAINTSSWRIEDLEQNRDQVKAFYVSWHRDLIGQ